MANCVVKKEERGDMTVGQADNITTVGNFKFEKLFDR